MLAAVNSNITAAKTILVATNANLAAMNNLRMKGKQEQSETTRCSENHFSMQQKYAALTCWSTKP